MSQELIYTSARKGLKLGSRGFCTVASTSGMDKNLADRLEALSGYKHIFSPGDPQSKLNPVNISYLRFKLGGRVYYQLSRIADAGLDYTQRTNKIAHHVVLRRDELPTAGPAWLTSQSGFFETAWEGESRILPAERPIPQGELQPDVCHAWAEIAGDAGWAGVLAESIFKRSASEAYLICKPGTDALALLLEAQSLLPKEKRWNATFSTYFTKVPPGIECRWRCVIDGTPEAFRAQRSPDKLVIDLTGTLPAAEGGALVEVARSGVEHVPAEAESGQFTDGKKRSRISTQPGNAPPPQPVSVSLPPTLPRQVLSSSSTIDKPDKRASIWKPIAIFGTFLLITVAGVVTYLLLRNDQQSVADNTGTTAVEGAGEDSRANRTVSAQADDSNDEQPPADQTENGMNSPNDTKPEDGDGKEDVSGKPKENGGGKSVGDEGDQGNRDAEEGGMQQSTASSLPDNLFQDLKIEVFIPAPPQGYQLQGKSRPVTLGTLPMLPPSLEISLVGVPSQGTNSAIEMIKAENDGSKWEILKGPEGTKKHLAYIEVVKTKTASTFHDPEPYTIEFHWQQPRNDVVKTIRYAGLRFDAPSVQPHFICFLSDEKALSTNLPRENSLRLIEKNLSKHVSTVYIPLNQDAVLYYRAGLSDGKQKEVDSWTFGQADQPALINLGIGGLELELNCSMDETRNLSCKFFLAYCHPSGDKLTEGDLVDWIEKQEQDRRFCLVNAIFECCEQIIRIDGMQSGMNAVTWITDWQPSRHGDSKDPLSGLRAHLRKRPLDELTMIEEDARKKLLTRYRRVFRTDFPKDMSEENRSELDKKTHAALKNHKELLDLDAQVSECPDLLRWLEIIETLKIDLTIKRRLRDPNNPNPESHPKVVVYRAGNID